MILEDMRSIEGRADDLLVRLEEFYQECKMQEYMDTGDAQAVINDCWHFVRQVKRACEREETR